MNKRQKLIIPRDYQKDAVDAIVKSLQCNDRAHAVMACGTGKTLVSLWVSEALKANTIVVFVPSLALIHQYMNEWLKCIKFESFSCMIICSSKNIMKKDEFSVNNIISEGFKVSTSRVELNKFLIDKEVETKIIFCTYQSSHVLAKIKKQRYDFAIYDEAHRTTGVEIGEFNVTLENIKIDKRLFVTATPKQITYIKNKKSSEIYSMDNERIYGPRSFTLGFNDAISKGIISDYRVIISFLGDVKDVKDVKDVHSEFYHKSNGLIKAIKKSGASKCITYHNSVSEAHEFSKYLIKNKDFNDFEVFHLSGYMKMVDRNNILNKFKVSKSCIITNSRCLTEGVDVPDADMIAFLNSKNSKVDIVQAIGRVVRKSKGKKIGNIFLPILLKSDISDIKSAIKATNYEVVWNVLNTISSSDFELSDIAKKTPEKAFLRGVPTRNIDRYTYIDCPFSAEEMEHLITVNFVEKSSDIYFEKMVAHLKKLIEKCKKTRKNMFGPFGMCKDNELKKFSERMRRMYRENALEENKIVRLQSVGFKWDVKLDSFEENLDCWKEYKKTKKSDSLLAEKARKWESYIRQSFFDKTLRADYLEKLIDCGFEFTPHNSKWNKSFNEIKSIGAKNITDPKHLVWVQRQRYLFRSNKLPAERKEQLDAIGVFFGKKVDDIFSNQYNEFLDLQENKSRSKVERVRLKKVKSNLKKWIKNGKYMDQQNLFSRREISSILTS